MDDEALIDGLIKEDADAIDQFAECENCVVTDWRDDAEEILDAITVFLPSGYWSCEGAGNAWQIAAGGRHTVNVAFIPKKQEPFFVQLNQVLQPDFELWRYRPADGDGYSLYLKPKGWWDNFRNKNPEIFEKYFESVESLAEFSGKSFTARLFSKQARSANFAHTPSRESEIPKPQKSPAHLLLLPIVFGVIGLSCYAGVRLACALAAIFRPNIQSFSSYHETTKTLIVIPSFLASIPLGFIVANLLVYAVRPLRHFFDQEAKSRGGDGFKKAMRDLLMFSKYWIPLMVAIGLGAALFGK